MLNRSISYFRLRLAVFSCGFIMAGTQVIIIRRAMALSGGDETVFALTITSWLLCTACGSALGSVFIRSRIKPATFFVVGMFAISIASPCALILFHGGAMLNHWTPGIAPGGGGLFLAILTGLLPICLLGGALFPLSCRILSDVRPHSVSRVFYLEAAGSFIAGIATTLIFYPALSGLGFLLFIALFGLTIAFSLVRIKIPFWLLLPGIVLCGIFLFPVAKKIDYKLFTNLRPGIRLMEMFETPYGIIEVTDFEGQRTVYENGLLLAVGDNPSGAEEQAHLSLVHHPNPHNVLWIGGFLGGGLTEALRHPSVSKVNVIELNPLLFQLSEVMSDSNEVFTSKNARIVKFQQDGRAFVSRADPESYDVILLNLPGPKTARLAKFYTIEAFRLYKRALKSGGIIVFSIESSEDYIGEDLAVLLTSMKNTLSRVFDKVVVLPGNNAIFVAGDSQAKPLTSAEAINNRLESRGIQPQYWDYSRLRDRLTGSRYDELDIVFAGPTKNLINRDGAPICFYLQQVFWSQQTRGGLPAVLKVLKKIFQTLGIIVIGLGFIVALFLRFSLPQRSERIGVPWAVVTVGLTGISLEIFTLIVFQVHYGSGYREVGMLMGFYMAGLALGAAITTRAKRKRSAFRIIQILWCFLPAGLILLSQNSLDESLISKVIYFVYMIMVGIAGGLHFPLAVSYVDKERSHRAGVFYSLDLFGAAFGALFVGLFALPLIGIAVSVYGLILLNLLPLLLILSPAKICSEQFK